MEPFSYGIKKKRIEIRP